MKKVLIIVTVVAIAASLFIGVKSNKSHDKFLQEMAVLDHENDSLKADIAVMDAQIDSLVTVDNALQDKLAHQKTKIIKIIETVDLAKAAIDTYSEHELVSALNKRYPADTITNPLPVAQPVLVSASKDLAELDGAKQVITVKDSTIALQDARISAKYTIISKYVAKEFNFKKIITNQDTQIQGWKGEYTKLEFQNKKLKLQNKFTKVAAMVVVGGLTYMTLMK